MVNISDLESIYTQFELLNSNWSQNEKYTKVYKCMAESEENWAIRLEIQLERLRAEGRKMRLAEGQKERIRVIEKNIASHNEARNAYYHTRQHYSRAAMRNAADLVTLETQATEILVCFLDQFLPPNLVLQGRDII